MRGRRPAGPTYVDKLDGDAETKRRLKVILQTMTGELRLQQACDILNVCEQRFHQLREEALCGALAALAPRPLGRPAQTNTAEQQQLQELAKKLAQAEFELQVAHARQEIAVVMPRLVKEPAEPTAAKEKKTRRRRR